MSSVYRATCTAPQRWYCDYAHLFGGSTAHNSSLWASESGPRISAVGHRVRRLAPTHIPASCPALMRGSRALRAERKALCVAAPSH
eukprot:3623418-Prymnesium_polylepis.1